ncbi:hypothetical protein LG634_05405 [Streptomyces bambusae]|uniref:hypothetical protein n=1 Tax=Streptomyces bambusae TaxID=1550616 RepID=UPI001CFE6EA4|nr:hypothetical protein [Streptomyces bambusae]MCB5164275.1 hypothetical protein [Streptomyces bambusae]
MERQPAPRASGVLPEPEELLTIACDVGRDYTRWRPRLTDAQQDRSWILLYRSGPLGVWAVGWHHMPPGTCYLDHEGIRGAVYVARGTLTHERVRLGSAPHTREFGPSTGFCFDETFYHRMRAAHDAGPTVSVHVFAADPAVIERDDGDAWLPPTAHLPG